MSKLVQALSRFNRKERYWLIRNALGETSARLGDGFRHDLGKLLGGSIPEDAWWAMDYHLEWLVDALKVYSQGEEVAIEQVYDNSATIIKGNQEDIDLVIAYNDTLILIEAKGDTSWSNEQLTSKLSRLIAIFADVQDKPSVRFVLMSPNPPEKLDVPQELTNWPGWTCGEKLLWMPLRMESMTGSGFLQVTRCKNAAGDTGAMGSHWKIIHNPPPQRKVSASGNCQ